MRIAQHLLCNLLPVTVLCFSLTGCAPSSDTVPVAGTVQYQGTPVANLSTVLFTPESGERPSMGSTNDNGQFKLTYTINEMGAKPGKYGVTFDWYPTTPDAKKSSAVEAILKKHGPGGKPYDVEITGPTEDLVINIQ